MSALGLAKYDAMRFAIEEARQVDEVKDIRDKARAMEVYVAQAHDREAERKVAEIRVRAERRCGQLLIEMPKAKGAANGQPGPGRGNKTQSNEATTFSDDQPTLAQLRISNEQSSQWQKLAEISEDKFEAALQTTAEVFGKATTQGVIDTAGGRIARIAFIEKPRGTFGTGENEWYTPVQYIELARAVMGHFDLDPASSSQANKQVKARQYFTPKTDGLNHEWRGKIWLNPPYSQPLMSSFVEHLASSVKNGDVTEAILLTHNYTDTAWFHTAQECCAAICFTRGRIGFLSPSGEQAAPTQGQAFFYYGQNRSRFVERFQSVGFVMVPHAL